MSVMWYGDRFFSVILLILITLAISVAGLFSRIDNVLYDVTQRYTNRVIPGDVVLVTIDEKSLSELGRWPWSRRLHAKLIDRLHSDGVDVIGFDILFAEPQLDDPFADQILSKAIANAGNVVLPVTIETFRRNGQLIEKLPLPILAEQAAAMGRVHAELDADAIARSITLWEGIGQPVWQHFVHAMLAVVGQLPDSMENTAPTVSDPSWGSLLKHDQRYINFSTAQHYIPSMSYVQVLQGEFTAGTFRNKIVLVGSTASGMADSLPTPVSGFQKPMPGVEFLANALLSMRSQTLVTLMPLWISTLLSCVVAVLPMLWLPYVSTRSGLLINSAFILLLLISVMALPVLFNVWVPLSAGFFGVLSSYPLWSWRKLESASQFLDAELSRLQKELGNFSTVQHDWGVNKLRISVDPFQRRIEQIRRATDHLQNLEQTHKETLAFISHDIRVPLASAATLIERDLGQQHSAYKQVSRALVLTEDFLQTSRAQMLRLEDFSDIDIIALLNEVADDIYPLAISQSLHLTRDLPEEPVWVRGHFDTLSRAVSNLLSNALKYSPHEGEINLSAQRYADQIQISVTDQGPGIPPYEMDRLFKRFSRLQSKSAHNQIGVGIGLYFVQSTVRQFGGEVQVQSKPGETIFILHFPISKSTIENQL